MIKRSSILLLAVFLAGFGALPALAAEPDEVAQTVADQGYYIEPGLEVSETRISNAVASGANTGARIFVVLLDENPNGGATQFATAVLDRLGQGTVLVLSATQEGVDSTEFSRADLDTAIDLGASASSSGGDAAYVDAFFRSLVGSEPDVVEPAASSGGGSGLLILLLIVGGLVLLVVFVVRRAKKERQETDRNRLDEARSEIKGQLDAMANTILEITDEVSLSESGQDNEYLEAAGTTYGRALEHYESATDLNGLGTLSDELDEARWQLDAARAIASGEPVPPKPKKEERHVCFFDPTHPDASEVAELKTPAGTKVVRVCKADAEKLRKGQQPDPRMIEVGGRTVPAPMAPKSHGGGGMNWLDVFSVVLGGAASSGSFDWGGGSRRRRPGGSIFGSGPSRSSTRTTSRSTSRTTGRSRSPGRASSPRTRSSGTRNRTGRSRRRNR